VDFATVTYSTTANKVYRFTVTGKNPVSSSYNIGIDRITLTP
jgi:hypothetical protein